MSGTYMLDALKNKWILPKDTHPSFKGLNVLLTGSNVGLGYEAALKFVQLGADKVILACRTIAKGEGAKRRIDAQTKRPEVTEVWQLDMLNYDSITAFAARAGSLNHLDIAVLNAGLLSMPYKKSDYGYEETMQVNVLSTAYLALLLLPKLRTSKTASHTPVLEIVGSGNAYIVSKLPSHSEPFASCNKLENWSVPLQYNYSKLFVKYVQAALVPLVVNKETGEPDVYITVVCPGACKSELHRSASAWYYTVVLGILEALLLRSAEAGARTYISGVDQGEKAHGKFWKNDTVRPPAPLQQDEEGTKLQRMVWKEITDALIKDAPEVRQLAAL